VVAAPQAELADLLDRDVDVVLGRQRPVDPEEAVALLAQVEEALDGDGLAGEVVAALVAVLAAAAATPAPATSGPQDVHSGSLRSIVVAVTCKS
jgi:hypothetical protein